MNGFKRFPRRSLLRVLTGIFFFWVQGPSAFTVETNFWQDRRSSLGHRKNDPSSLLASLPLPPFGGGVVSREKTAWISKAIAPYGVVREVYLSPTPNAPLIIHLQDVHGVEEAQRNLSGMVSSLAKGGVEWVGLEGAVGPLAIGPYRASPYPDITRALADAFLKIGYLTGPEAAAITAERPPALWGVENLELYADHLKAFSESEGARAAVRASVASLSSAVDEAGVRYDSPELRDLARHRRAFDANQESASVFAKYLWRLGPKDKRAFPNVALLVRQLETEERIDFKDVEKERAALVEALTRKLSASVLSELSGKTAEYRYGILSAGDYYRSLARYCADHGIPLEAFPKFKEYVSYVLSANRIQHETLLEELDALEAAANDRWAKTETQAGLVKARRMLGWVEKLISHQLSPQEWVRYKKEKAGLGDLPKKLSKWIGREVNGVEGLTPATLAPFERFCERALDRNAVLVGNSLDKMAAEKVSSGMLVAGGFHTAGMTRILRQREISYVVVSPRFSKAIPLQAVFVREPLPLEKLLAGEGISLSYPLLAQPSGVVGQVSDGASRQKACQVQWETLEDILDTLKSGFGGEDVGRWTLLTSGFETLLGVSSHALKFRGRHALAMKVTLRGGGNKELLLVSDPEGLHLPIPLPGNEVYQGKFTLDSVTTVVRIYDLHDMGPLELGPTTWARNLNPKFWVANGNLGGLASELWNKIQTPSPEAQVEAIIHKLHDRLVSAAVNDGDPLSDLEGIAEHMRRVGDLAMYVSREFGLSPEDTVDLFLAGLSHDIGKFNKACRYLFLSSEVFSDGSVEGKKIVDHEDVLAKMLAAEIIDLGPDVEMVHHVHSILGPRSKELFQSVANPTERNVRLALFLAMLDVADATRGLDRGYIQTRIFEMGEPFATPEVLRGEFRKYTEKLRKSGWAPGVVLADRADKDFDALLNIKWFLSATEKTLFEHVADRVKREFGNGQTLVLDAGTFATLLRYVNQLNLFSAATPASHWFYSLVESIWLRGKTPEEKEAILSRLPSVIQEAAGQRLSNIFLSLTPLNMFVGNDVGRIRSHPFLHLGGAVAFENLLRVATISGSYALAVGMGAGPLAAFLSAFLFGGVVFWALCHKVINWLVRFFFPGKKVAAISWKDAVLKIPAGFITAMAFGVLALAFDLPSESLFIADQVKTLALSPWFLGSGLISTVFQAALDAFIAFRTPQDLVPAISSKISAGEIRVLAQEIAKEKGEKRENQKRIQEKLGGGASPSLYLELPPLQVRTGESIQDRLNRARLALAGA